VEDLLLVVILVLAAGAGLWSYLVLLGHARIRDRAALAVYGEICRRAERLEELGNRGYESPLLHRYRRFRDEARRELDRLGIPAPSRKRA
jgi:hypothetical protein